ncbi:hypothetical protein AGMMS50293_16380 [Spirochaetia bacterium]|nr:hypothetical protein AGMMS50293_16380 [Spirochaetia bacterium]
MNILAIDTAVSVLSVALSAGDDVWCFEADAGLRHSELAMDSVDLLFKKAGLEPGELSGVLCMGGPGSFTGLRIGFSLAKGMALALGIPFVPIPSLDCMAHPFSCRPGLVIPVIDAKKSAFFCALYSGGRQLCPGMDAGPALIAQTITGALESLPGEKQVLLTGPDAEKLYPLLPEGLASLAGGALKGYARTLLDIAKKCKIFDNCDTDWFSGPEYIRKSDAELNL